MTAPARQVRTRQAATPRVRTTPSSRPHLRVVAPKPRKRGGFGFWILSTVVLGSIVVAMAVTYALLAQGSFAMSDLSATQRALTRTNTDLRIQIEELSSTKRVSAYADDNGMVMPADVEVITAADTRGSDHNGPSRDHTGGDG